MLVWDHDAIFDLSDGARGAKRPGSSEVVDKGTCWVFLTSATSAKGSITVAAFGTSSNNLSVNILGVVGRNVACAAAAVRNFGTRHCDCVVRIRCMGA